MAFEIIIQDTTAPAATERIPVPDYAAALSRLDQLFRARRDERRAQGQPVSAIVTTIGALLSVDTYAERELFFSHYGVSYTVRRAVGVAGIDLDALQAEAEKLVSLLKDRQPGLVTWRRLLAERLRSLRRFLPDAAGTV